MLDLLLVGKIYNVLKVMMSPPLSFSRCIIMELLIMNMCSRVN